MKFDAISFVIPCLNEEDTIGKAVEVSLKALKDNNLEGEVVVVDNASTDGTAIVALGAGARVVREERRGYGSAITRGVREAKYSLVFMADADLSYDLNEAPLFLNMLKEDNADLVIGCRFPYGGGVLEKGAMPTLNRAGNFFLSYFARALFGIKAHDFHCGARLFKRDKFLTLGMKSEGMEFASEMVIRFHRAGYCISEKGIFLRKDERVVHGSHLRPMRDGIRHMKCILGIFFGIL